MPECRDPQHFHSVVILPCFWAASADRRREEGKNAVDFYEAKEEENQVPIIRISQVSAWKRKKKR